MYSRKLKPYIIIAVFIWSVTKTFVGFFSRQTSDSKMFNSNFSTK